MAVITKSNNDSFQEDAIILSSGAFEHFMEFIIENSDDLYLSSLAQEYHSYHYLELHDLPKTSQAEFIRMADEYSKSITIRDGENSPYSVTCINMAIRARRWFDHNT